MQRTIRALASDADTGSICRPLPMTVALPGPAISFSTSSAMRTCCCCNPPSAQPMLSSRKRFAWYTASNERSSYFTPAAHCDMVAVSVCFFVPAGVAVRVGIGTGSLSAQVLERQEGHEIGVMHDVRLGRALHQVALGRVGRD